jgi:fumarate reductase subunit D
MDNSPEKRSEWRAIFYVQARVAILFVPVVVSLLAIATLAGNRDADAIDRTVTGSVK